MTTDQTSLKGQTKVQQAETPKATVKKRTIYNPKGMLELPEWAKKDKTHYYRWVSKRRMSRSDGFDPRGWTAARDPEGHTLEAYDAILSKMPLEEHDAMMAYKAERARSNMDTILENIANQSDRIRYEVEKLGGKYSNTDFSVERKI